jgi:hypothetical protein
MTADHLLSYLFGVDLGLLASCTLLVAVVGLIEIGTEIAWLHPRQPHLER